MSLVINYDPPAHPKKYLHRCCRTGRSTRKGMAISFKTDDDMHLLQTFQQFYNMVIEELLDNIADIT